MFGVWGGGGDQQGRFCTYLLDTSPKSVPSLELHSYIAATSVEAHHRVSGPTGRNSGRRWIKKYRQKFTSQVLPISFNCSAACLDRNQACLNK